MADVSCVRVDGQYFLVLVVLVFIAANGQLVCFGTRRRRGGGCGAVATAATVSRIARNVLLFALAFLAVSFGRSLEAAFAHAQYQEYECNEEKDSNRSAYRYQQIGT